MYNPYDAISTLNREAIRCCEEYFLDPDSDHGAYGGWEDDDWEWEDEEMDDDPC